MPKRVASKSAESRTSIRKPASSVPPASVPVKGPARRLTKDQLSEIEGILSSDLRRAMRSASMMEETFSIDRDRSSAFGDAADASDALVEAERASVLGEHTSRTISDLRRALALLHSHPAKYGICEISGEPIPYERLLVMPTARTLARFAA